MSTSTQSHVIRCFQYICFKRVLLNFVVFKFKGLKYLKSIFCFQPFKDPQPSIVFFFIKNYTMSKWSTSLKKNNCLHSNDPSYRSKKVVSL